VLTGIEGYNPNPYLLNKNLQYTLPKIKQVTNEVSEDLRLFL
jgi:hypothetical protein